MKKLILSFCILLSGYVSYASVQHICELIPLEVSIIDPTDPTTPLPRNPIEIPKVYQDGYVLSFDTSCIGTEMQVVHNGIVVYSTEITSNDLQLLLPSSLSGNYELRIYSGIYCFYGYIEL